MADESLGVAQLLEIPGSDREPVAETYDAVVGLTPANHRHQRAFAIVKFAFRIGRHGCTPDVAEPLAHDLRDEDADPRLVPGSDFHLWKGATDVVVQGSVFPPEGRPAPWVDAGVQIGGVQKVIRAWGDREVVWGGGGRVRFSDPAPFDEMPLDWSRAYGGIDWRVEVRDDDPNVTRYLTEADHPGMYPRNPFGRGYVVVPEDPGETVLLPNLEDPEDPLREDSFVVSDPRTWYRQPIPWNLGWVHPFMWPRCVYFVPGVDAWYPGPEDGSMPEVSRGFLESGYREMMRRDYPGGMHPRFVQEASHGLSIVGMRGDESVHFWRLDPREEELRTRLPFEHPPLIEFEMDGRLEAATPRLNHVVCRPAERQILMVWVALKETPRTYVPGIHRHIPLSIRVQGDAPILYETPPTVREEISAARATARSDEKEQQS